MAPLCTVWVAVNMLILHHKRDAGPIQPETAELVSNATIAPLRPFHRQLQENVRRRVTLCQVPPR